MYMSYCRYEGTLQELRACLCDAEEHAVGEAEYPVSNSEIIQFQNMIRFVHSWMQDMALLDCDGNLNGVELDLICQAMAKSGENDY